jgi:very-short-patch-repair endonuclease
MTLVGDKSPHYGHRNSDITKEKMSDSRKKWFETHDHPLLGKSHSEESKRKMSDAKIGVYAGVGNPMFGKKHRADSIKKMFAYRPMNSLETKVAAELDRLGLKYTYQFFINDGKLCRSFDFKLKRRPFIIEADGDYWHGNPNTNHHFSGVEETKENDKIKEEMARNRGYKVIRFWESDINKDPTIIETRLLSEGIVPR